MEAEKKISSVFFLLVWVIITLHPYRDPEQDPDLLEMLDEYCYFQLLQLCFATTTKIFLAHLPEEADASVSCKASGPGKRI
jgi:hypothetical protein